MSRGRPNGAKGKPLEQQNFTLAELALRLGRRVTGCESEERLTLARVAKAIGLKDRGSYYWTRGKVAPDDPEGGPKPFIPPTSFDEARGWLVEYAQAFVDGYEAENRRWLAERKRQLDAALDLLKLFRDDRQNPA